MSKHDDQGEAMEAFLERHEAELYEFSVDASWTNPRFASYRCDARHPKSGRRCYYGRGHEVDHEAVGMVQPREKWSP